MDQALPIIYTRTVDPRAVTRLPFGPRLLSLGIALACLAVLVLAARLSPSPTGMGSHRALGLNSCQFLESTGLPCPSCGMTTSFTWFARGHVLASIYVQPMGAAIAFIAACCVWGGLYIAASGRPVYRLLWLVPGRYYLLPLLTVGVLAWGWKILIHLNGLDGWG